MKEVRRTKPAAEAAQRSLLTPEEIGVKIPPKDIADIPKLKPVAKKLSAMVLQRRALTEKIKALEDQKKALDEQIQPILFRADVKKCMVEDFTVSIVESGHKQLSKLKLIEHGVSPDVINECEEYIPHAPYVRVDAPRS